MDKFDLFLILFSVFLIWKDGDHITREQCKVEMKKALMEMNNSTILAQSASMNMDDELPQSEEFLAGSTQNYPNKTSSNDTVLNYLDDILQMGLNVFFTPGNVTYSTPINTLEMNHGRQIQHNDGGTDQIKDNIGDRLAPVLTATDNYSPTWSDRLGLIFFTPVFHNNSEVISPVKHSTDEKLQDGSKDHGKQEINQGKRVTDPVWMDYGFLYFNIDQFYSRDEIVNETRDEIVNQTRDEIVNQIRDEVVNQARDEIVNQTRDDILNQSRDEFVNQTSVFQSLVSITDSIYPWFISGVSNPIHHMEQNIAAQLEDIAESQTFDDTNIPSEAKSTVLSVICVITSSFLADDWVYDTPLFSSPEKTAIVTEYNIPHGNLNREKKFVDTNVPISQLFREKQCHYFLICLCWTVVVIYVIYDLWLKYFYRAPTEKHAETATQTEFKTPAQYEQDIADLKRLLMLYVQDMETLERRVELLDQYIVVSGYENVRYRERLSGAYEKLKKAHLASLTSA